MIATTDAEHTIRALRAEIGDIRYALDQRAAKLEQQALAEHAGDIEVAAKVASELAHSSFWFRAFHEKSRQLRVLKAELARLKGERGG